MATRKAKGTGAAERGDSDDDASLAFGLGSGDRTVPTKKAGRRTKAKPRKARGSGKGGGKRGGGLGWRLAKVAFLVFGIGFLGAAGVIAYYAARLPATADWTVPAKQPSVRILAADGSLITNHSDTNGQSLSLDEMSPYLPEAVVAIEDRRFYYHFGIDPIGLIRAAFTNIAAGGVVQGGSTLTQQLAKNLFLTPDRTFQRKIQEMILAVWLEMRLSKKQILELYLNRVYLGAGAYGVDAAAHRYFGKSARTLNLAEAATIAGLLKAPSYYSPIANPAAAKARATQVLQAMREAGTISDKEVSLAEATKVAPVNDVADGSGRYVADWVMDQLPDYVGSVDRDIIVDTSIDLRLQAAAASAISQTLDESGKKYGVGQAAMVAIDPDGAVKALVGGRDYASSPFNRAVSAMRQPGSSFKPFVYLTALEDGLIPETVRVDQPVSIAGWKPQNYEKDYKGPVTLTTALALSLNTVSAQLTAEVGPQAVVATAHRLGISSPLEATPSIALGTSEVTPLEMTAAFVPFSNGGRGIIAHVINRITDDKGNVLYQRSGTGRGQVIDPLYVGMMNAMLEQTVLAGTGQRAKIPGWQSAGKTGTSQDFRDAWFIGYTAALTTGVWFGNDDDSPTKKASGSNLPALAWNRFMSVALKGVQPANLPGNYQIGAPQNYVAQNDQIGNMVATTGEDGRPLNIAPETDPIGQMAEQDDGDPDAGLPLPPTGVGSAAGNPQYVPVKRRNFFERLFGG
ncbi:MAG TPA: PBP1A family penicillin-binding protein [Bauldia sp.]|nr:PBP1A family penicillin-binding protein [Bauldia sp.]